MAHLIIKEIGPIKNVDIELNKINIFMGPQSSGKSTIAKIISFCFWLEKNICLSRENVYLNAEANFSRILEEYHNLQSYINENSYIKYESNYLSIEYKGSNPHALVIPKLEWKELITTYKRSKIIYIPSERNLIAIPNWATFKLPNNNLKDFLSDWGFARELFSKTKPLNIPSLNIKYYNSNDNAHTDYISLSSSIDKKEKAITIANASSGIQSLTPLYLLNKVYCRYKKEISENSSYEDTQTLTEVYGHLRYSLIRRYSYTKENKVPEHDAFNYKGIYCTVAPGNKENAIRILDNFTETQLVQSIIEEPEQNLFPYTQQSMMYELIADILSNEDNQLIITTHSPYILFALDNCIMGGLVGNNIPEEERADYPSHLAWINPKKISLYEIHEGELKCIQNEDGTLEDNYLNQAYKENSNEYVSLLNYYENEE